MLGDTKHCQASPKLYQTNPVRWIRSDRYPTRRSIRPSRSLWLAAFVHFDFSKTASYQIRWLFVTRLLHGQELLVRRGQFAWHPNRDRLGWGKHSEHASLEPRTLALQSAALHDTHADFWGDTRLLVSLRQTSLGGRLLSTLPLRRLASRVLIVVKHK